MRFHGVLIEPEIAANVLGALDRVAADFFLVMTPTHWHFRLQTSYTGEDRVFVEFQTSSIFSQYAIESRAENRIPLIGPLSSLCRALRSARGTHETLVCLDCRDGQALLCFQISKDRGQPSLYQKIPITVRPPTTINEGAEPSLQPPFVRIRMPNLRVLSRVVDRMKAIGDDIVIQANTDGEAIFSVRNDLAQVRTMYRDLRFHPRNRDSQPPDTDSATCKVAAKCLSKMLSCCSMDAATVVGCIAENAWFVVFMEIGDRMATVTYYVPVIVDDY